VVPIIMEKKLRIIDTDNSPKKIDNRCVWHVGEMLDENVGMANLGILAKILDISTLKGCYINFKETEWGDPLPLLYLCLILKEFNTGNTTIDLGELKEKDKDQHSVFLKFLSHQGFLLCLGESSKLVVNRRIKSVDSNLTTLLESTPAQTHYKNSDCIFASVISLDAFVSEKDDFHADLQERVEKLVHEARARAIDGFFGKIPRERDLLFQKLRKILFELLLNSADHAHTRDGGNFCGIYARVRGGRPSTSDEAVDWDYHLKKEQKVFGQSKFSPNIHADWVELYVCDIGVGLIHDLEKWITNAGDRETKSLLGKVKKSTNKLHSLSTLLFSKAISKDPRHNATKTSVTGLKDLGQLLKEGHDYCRLYVNGAWVGNHFPWILGEDGHPSCTQRNIQIQPHSNSYRNLLELADPMVGTGYVFSIQPHRYKPNKKGIITNPEPEILEDIKDALRKNECSSSLFNLKWFDFRMKSNFKLPDIAEHKQVQTLVLRPPRHMSKEDVSRWIELIAGRGGVKPVWTASVLVFAELSFYQAIWLSALLEGMKVHIESQVSIFVTTEEWGSTCFHTNTGSVEFKLSKANNDYFMSSNEGTFNIVHLALLLREIDSDIFWSSNVKQCLFTGNIDWPSEEKREDWVLNQYLDFPHALTYENKYRACRRALKRCLSLFPALEPIAGDQFVVSLVKDALIRMHKVHEGTDECVVVDSVAVTTDTAKKYRNRKFKNAVEAIHIFANPSSTAINVHETLRALLWVDEDFNANNATELTGLNWKRILNTPYIAPNGEASISVLRYRRRKDGSLNFDKSWFGRTPQMMYSDFEKLGILKLGHWNHNLRHDLLTINLGMAFEYSQLRKGSMYKWVCERIETTTLQVGEKSKFLFYPSHYSTDKIISSLNIEPFFSDLITRNRVIPIKLMGQRTVSPLLVPALVKYRVEQVLKDENIEHWEAVILDDGIVSGKHMSELMQSLTEFGANKVRTIAILDRTGAPVTESALKKMRVSNFSYWKWDVPGLGFKRDCALCQGLNISSTYKNSMPTATLQKRILAWESEWKLSDATTDWHTSGVEPIWFETPVEVTFGIDIQRDSEKRKKKLKINNSVHLSSILAELTRLTTRSDVTLKKAKHLWKERGNPEAALQIITVQLVQFIDELSFWEKRERYIYILELLSDIDTVNQNTSLSGLCFTLIDKDLVPDLWEFVVFDLIKRREIVNLDLAISILIILKKGRYHFGLDQNEPNNNKTDIEIRNSSYLSIGKTREYLRNFLNLFRIPQMQAFSIHSGPFIDCLRDLPSKKSDNTQVIIDDLNFLIRNTRALIEILHGLHNNGYTELPGTTELVRVCENLESKCRINDVLTAADEDYVKGQTKTLNELLTGKANGNKSSVLWNVSNQLFRTLEAKTPVKKILGDIVSDIECKWTSFYTMKKNASPGISERWEQSFGLIKPIFALSNCVPNGGIWESKSYFIWDLHTKEVIRDILSNVIYSDKPISDHLDGNDLGMKADMWWAAEIVDNYLKLTFMNSSKDSSVKLTTNYTFAGFERLGGEREVKVDKLSGIIKIFVKIPLDIAYINEGVIQ
jgi:hypothetical protein